MGDFLNALLIRPPYREPKVAEVEVAEVEVDVARKVEPKVNWMAASYALTVLHLTARRAGDDDDAKLFEVEARRQRHASSSSGVADGSVSWGAEIARIVGATGLKGEQAAALAVELAKVPEASSRRAATKPLQRSPKRVYSAAGLQRRGSDRLGPGPVSDRIAAAYGVLTSAERRVAEVVLHDPQFAASGTVSELAAQSGTGAATVVRFAVKLGYDGFSGLHVAVQEELRNRPRSAFTRGASTSTSIPKEPPAGLRAGGGVIRRTKA